MYVKSCFFYTTYVSYHVCSRICFVLYRIRLSFDINPEGCLLQPFVTPFCMPRGATEANLHVNTWPTLPGTRSCTIKHMPLVSALALQIISVKKNAINDDHFGGITTDSSANLGIKIVQYHVSYVHLLCKFDRAAGCCIAQRPHASVGQDKHAGRACREMADSRHGVTWDESKKTRPWQ